MRSRQAQIGQCGQIAFCIFRIVRRAQSRMTAAICCCSARRDCACFHSRSLSSDRAFCLSAAMCAGGSKKKLNFALGASSVLYARVRPNFRPLNQKSHDFRLDFPRSCCWRLIAGEPGAAYAPIHLHEFTINFRISRAYLLCE
jgi:hypothetical protein